MSEIPDNYADHLNLREQITRIDRSIDEAAKFRAEQQKLMAEARKFRWDPIIVISGAIVAGAFLRLPEILHAFGIGQERVMGTLIGLIAATVLFLGWISGNAFVCVFLSLGAIVLAICFSAVPAAGTIWAMAAAAVFVAWVPCLIRHAARG